MSERIRANVQHISEIQTGQAIDLLMKYQCKHSLAEKIASLCDGRLILVMRAISIISEKKKKHVKNIKLQR